MSIAAGVAAGHYRNTGFESAEAKRQFIQKRVGAVGRGVITLEDFRQFAGRAMGQRWKTPDYGSINVHRRFDRRFGAGENLARRINIHFDDIESGELGFEIAINEMGRPLCTFPRRHFRLSADPRWSGSSSIGHGEWNDHLTIMVVI